MCRFYFLTLHQIKKTLRPEADGIETGSKTMKYLTFDERNRAYVSEQEFMDYLAQTADAGDYTKDMEVECQVGEKDWRVCDCTLYYNSAGCKLALYNRDFNYGETF